MGAIKGVVLGLLIVATVLSGRAQAEPSYLLYPSTPAVFHYDASRYEIVTSGHPKYDASFAIANVMLWDRIEQRVPVEIYRAPFLTGFEMSTAGRNEFVTYGNDFDVIVDGFNDSPRIMGNLCLRFWPESTAPYVQVFVDGVSIPSLTIGLSALTVSTAIPGGFYADVDAHTVSWAGSPGLEIIAFSDKDGNSAFEGTASYRIRALSASVPVQETTWGSVKALFR
jgi:hypothetical protein